MKACHNATLRNDMVIVVPTYMLGPLGAVSMLVLIPVMGCGDVRDGLLLLASAKVAIDLFHWRPVEDCCHEKYGTLKPSYHPHTAWIYNVLFTHFCFNRPLQHNVTDRKTTDQWFNAKETKRHNSIADTLDLCLFCTRPSTTFDFELTTYTLYFFQKISNVAKDLGIISEKYCFTVCTIWYKLINHRPHLCYLLKASDTFSISPRVS